MDKDDEAYDGDKTYRLHVPPDAPVEQHWSVTAYDRETHALIKGMNRAGRASNAADLQKNADGSVDVWFGPKVPQGKKSNWVPTDPNRRFELMFRFYAPTKALFDKAWTLPDVEKAKFLKKRTREPPPRNGDPCAICLFALVSRVAPRGIGVTRAKHVRTKPSSRGAKRRRDPEPPLPPFHPWIASLTLAMTHAVRPKRALL
jgi:Protein of unknown function (DUF1214)